MWFAIPNHKNSHFKRPIQKNSFSLNDHTNASKYGNKLLNPEHCLYYENIVQSLYDTCCLRVRSQLQALPCSYYANRCPIKKSQRRVSEFGESKQGEHWESKWKPL